jgi:hypothetical protein
MGLEMEKENYLTKIKNLYIVEILLIIIMKEKEPFIIKIMIIILGILQIIKEKEMEYYTIKIKQLNMKVNLLMIYMMVMENYFIRIVIMKGILLKAKDMEKGSYISQIKQ